MADWSVSIVSTREPTAPAHAVSFQPATFIPTVNHHSSSVCAPSSLPVVAVENDPHLREALKRCPPATYEAALAFRRTSDVRHLPAIVRGVVAHYVEPDLRPRLSAGADELRLIEDLALDSLTLMEIVLLAEDVLQVTLTADELRRCRTVGDVQLFFEWKVRGIPAAAAAWAAVS